MLFLLVLHCAQVSALSINTMGRYYLCKDRAAHAHSVTLLVQSVTSVDISDILLTLGISTCDFPQNVKRDQNLEFR